MGANRSREIHESVELLQLARAGALPIDRFGALLKGLNLAAGPLAQEPIYRGLLLFASAVLGTYGLGLLGRGVAADR